MLAFNILFNYKNVDNHASIFTPKIRYDIIKLSRWAIVMKKDKNPQSSNMVEEMEPIPTLSESLEDAKKSYQQGAIINAVKLGVTLNGPNKPRGGR